MRLLESNKRSLVKSLSYRAFGTITTVLVTFSMTRKAELAVAAGILDTFLKVGLYFVHERAWTKFRYGLIQPAGVVYWLTGLSGSGKTTLAKKMLEYLSVKDARSVVWLDGDQIRKIFPQTGFAREDRMEHIKRVAHAASLLEKQGHVVVVSMISPYLEARFFARELCQNFHEIYLAADLSVCQARDAKGLYKKAAAGEIKLFTGVHDVYEPPPQPELIVDTGRLSVEESISTIQKYLKKKRLL
jgi:adenylylsulfate kinase